jgi:outer membrane protein OmpA-like peptidoglycan-associated protein
VVREGFSRDGVARPGGVRAGTCGDDGCEGRVRVDAVRLPPVRLPDVDIAPLRLATVRLAGRDDLDVVRGHHGTAYVAPANVLFDTDQYRIRPDAGAALHLIADRIRSTAPRRHLLVEGHTDDRGTAAHGLVLSRQRARAVADWLGRHGLDRARIRTRGYGEADPVVPNTSAANRQRNRRVVVTVLPR